MACKAYVDRLAGSSSLGLPITSDVVCHSVCNVA